MLLSFSLKKNCIFLRGMRSTIKYNSIVSAGHHLQIFVGIQCLQNHFLCLTSYQFDIPRQPRSPYKPLLDTLNMSGQATYRSR